MRRVACSLLFLCGCIGTGLQEDFVLGQREVYDGVAPKYLRYVEADGSLDDSVKRSRVTLVNEWKRLIEQAENAMED